jgi:hypothetical protein
MKFKKNKKTSRSNLFPLGRKYFGENKKDLIASRIIEYFNLYQEFSFIIHVIFDLRKALMAKRI